jgi:hypothetical protein
MAMTLRRTNRYGLNTAVRIHGYTKKGLVTKRPADHRVYHIQGVLIEHGCVFYTLRCEADGKVWERYSEPALKKAA